MICEGSAIHVVVKEDPGSRMLNLAVLKDRRDRETDVGNALHEYLDMVFDPIRVKRQYELKETSKGVHSECERRDVGKWYLVYD
jgi:hypothetical protein